MSHTWSSRGLTLIEVLVLIVILFVIFMMIVPTGDRGRPWLETRCLGNQRQIGMGMLLYAEDFGQRYPNRDALPGNDGPLALMLVTNYVREGKTFMCPYVFAQHERNQQPSIIPEINAAFFLSNGNDYAYYDGLNFPSPTNAFVADRLAWTNRQLVNISRISHPQGSINVVFGDGHGESAKPTKVIGANYSPAWSAVQDPLLRP